MLFYSLTNPSLKSDFREATITGQADDKGLFFPQSIPVLPESFIREINRYCKEEIALTVIKPYVGDVIPEAILMRIVSETMDFDFPLVPVSEAISSLELFHGPTLAFKDVGARFMSRCLGYFVSNSNHQVTVLVATSGDTGGAVASGFYEVAGVEVVILYPSGKVSEVQERQLTTMGKNITAIEVAGDFDDCQQMVKQAFADKEVTQKLFLTSANSINVARWLPQQFYYFLAWQQWSDKNRPPVIAVPSGNFGNICAGLLAHKSGLPAKHFIAACNANDVIPKFLQHGHYEPRKAVATLSNAMDVGNPSNFVRILELFNNKSGSLKDTLSSYSISDEETIQTIQDVFQKYHYVLDPHGAVGYKALQQYLALHPDEKGYFLETAHPVKFHDQLQPVTGHAISFDAVRDLLHKEKKSVKLDARYEQLKEYLLYR